MQKQINFYCTPEILDLVIPDTDGDDEELAWIGGGGGIVHHDGGRRRETVYYVPHVVRRAERPSLALLCTRCVLRLPAPHHLICGGFFHGIALTT